MQSSYGQASQHTFSAVKQAANNGPTPAKHPKIARNAANELVSMGKIHYVGPNKMVLTYYESENADPVLEDHFSRSLARRPEESKAGSIDRQRSRKLPPSFWIKRPRNRQISTPPASTFLPNSACSSSSSSTIHFPSATTHPVPPSYPYPQSSRYAPTRQIGQIDPQGSSNAYNPFLKPTHPSLNLYPSIGGQGGPHGRYGQGGPTQVLPGVGSVPQPQTNYGSFFHGFGPGSGRLGSGTSPYTQSGFSAKGSEWGMPPPLGGPFGTPTGMDLTTGGSGFGSGILPPPAYGTFTPGIDGPPIPSSQDSFLSPPSWTNFM